MTRYTPVGHRPIPTQYYIDIHPSSLTRYTPVCHRPNPTQIRWHGRIESSHSHNVQPAHWTISENSVLLQATSPRLRTGRLVFIVNRLCDPHNPPINKTFSYLSSPGTSTSSSAASVFPDPRLFWPEVRIPNHWGRVDLTTLPT